MFALLGKKRGMTQIFQDDGTLLPVTVIEAGPCMVAQKKTKAKEGYDALQLAFGKSKAGRLTKAQKGHFEKKKLELYGRLGEFRTSKAAHFEVGDMLTVAALQVGDTVDVTGVTKGHGFSGVMKKEGKHGGPDSHGSDFHRRPGSIGMRTWPARVLKNMGMPGHYGCVTQTVKNLKVVAVKPEQNLVLVEGSVPGHRNGDVVVVHRKKDFEKAVKEKENNGIGSPQ